MPAGKQANHQAIEQAVLANDDARQCLAQFKNAGLIRHDYSSHP
jgi:hypothetical protein